MEKGHNVRAFLDIDNLRTGADSNNPRSKRLVVSANPDLKTDYGHFLNYERRIKESCQALGAEYLCFANKAVEIIDSNIHPIFPHDSGYYSLVRKSARMHERQIAAEFAVLVQSHLSKLSNYRNFEQTVIFFYCGSSLLASYLCSASWDRRVVVVINAFWDFLLPNDFRNYEHVSRIAFQNQVKLLAMSEPHQEEIEGMSGLRFDWIPNPPPLLGDADASKATKDLIVARQGRLGVRVLLPGLMSQGKGREFTTAFCHLINEGRIGDVNYTVRDRLGSLPVSTSPKLKLLVGDFSVEEIICLYKESDFAILPYDAETFRVRTSGALIDCLVFGVVPIVLAGTWLAHICEHYGFGIILDSMVPEQVHKAVEKAALRLQKERTRLVPAAFRYLNDNSWGRLAHCIVDGCEVNNARPLTVRDQLANSPFSEANRLYRSGAYCEAGRIYLWLSEAYDLPIYKNNLTWCARKVRLPVEDFILLLKSNIGSEGPKR